MQSHDLDIGPVTGVRGRAVSINGKIAGHFGDYWKHLKLFSRNVRLYLAGSFLSGLTFACYLLLLNLYLRELGATESFIGQVLSAGAVGMSLMSVPAAFILRRIRLKKILIGSSILYAITILLLTQLPIGNQLIIVSLVAGMAMTFYRVAAAPFFMRNSSSKERTYVFSLSFGISVFASMIGSLIFGELVAVMANSSIGTIGAYRWTFILAVGLGAAAIIPFSLIKAHDPTEEDAGSDFSLGLLKRRLGLYGKLLFPLFIVGTGAGLIIPFLNLYFRDRFGQPPDKIGFFYFAVNTTMLIGILAGPILARKFGMIRAVVWTQLLSMPFMVVLAYTYSLPVAFAAFLIRGALMNLGVPIGTNFGMEMVEKSEQALVNALLMLAWTSSWMVSTAIGGHMIELYGYTPPLLVAVALYFISSISYFLFFRRMEVNTGNGYKIEMVR